MCQAGSVMSAARAVGAAGRLENQSVRAVASRLGIQPVIGVVPAVEAASVMAADQSVEPGGPEK